MKKQVYDKAMQYLRSTYLTIVKRSAEALPYFHGELCTYDIVHSTIEKIIRDPNVLEIKDDQEFIDYFLYREKTVVFKEVHNKKLRFKTHANYYEAQKEVQER